MPYFFRYIYKEKLVKISAYIAFLFYKEIYMKYLIYYIINRNIKNKSLYIK